MPMLDYGLNKCRLSEYRNTFSKYVEILEEFAYKIEGKKFLTESVKHELNQYSEEELLTSYKTFLARKKIAKSLIISWPKYLA